MEPVDEEDKRIEEDMKRFKELIERKYSGTPEDILKKLDTINHELAQVIGSMVTKEVFVLEMRNLMIKTDALDKRIDDWRDATKIYFTVLGVIIAIVGIVVPIVIVLLTGIIS